MLYTEVVHMQQNTKGTLKKTQFLLVFTTKSKITKIKLRTSDRYYMNICFFIFFCSSGSF